MDFFFTGEMVKKRKSCRVAACFGYKNYVCDSRRKEPEPTSWANPERIDTDSDFEDQPKEILKRKRTPNTEKGEGKPKKVIRYGKSKGNDELKKDKTPKMVIEDDEIVTSDEGKPTIEGTPSKIPEDEEESQLKKKTQIVLKGNKKKKGLKEGKKPIHRVNFDICITTRSSPSSLQTAMKNLEDEEKEVIREMGFGSMLDLKIDTLPSKIGLWLVKNFCPDRKTIKLRESKEILIT